MGISNLTAMTIQGRDDLIVTSTGPFDNGKYAGWITHSADKYCRPLLNTDAFFDDAESAEKHMRDLMSDIRANSNKDA